MIYALVNNDVIIATTGPYIYNHNGRDWDFRFGLRDNAYEYGWRIVTDTVRPADTQTTTWEQELVVENGQPIYSWVERAKTAEELANDQENLNTEILSSNLDVVISDMLSAVESIKAVIGSGTDPAGTSSLRAMKSISNNQITSGQNIKALIDLLITLSTEVRRLARIDVRLARLQTSQVGSTNTGTE